MSRRRQILRRFPITLFVALSLWYMVGGTGGFRQVGTRIRRWFAPTPQEIRAEAAAAAAAPRATADLPVRQPRIRKGPLTDPLPLGRQLAVVGGLIVVTFGTMHVTGRKS
jgi:hypothetical protein